MIFWRHPISTIVLLVNIAWWSLVISLIMNLITPPGGEAQCANGIGIVPVIGAALPLISANSFITMRKCARRADAFEYIFFIWAVSFPAILFFLFLGWLLVW